MHLPKLKLPTTMVSSLTHRLGLVWLSHLHTSAAALAACWPWILLLVSVLASARGYGIVSFEMIGRLGHFKLCIYPLTHGYTSKLVIRGSYAKGREESLSSRFIFVFQRILADLVPTSSLYFVTCSFFLSQCK
ncbi:hypothetical protein PVAP13_1NG020600 [Panicum virgatum]|uniref:Uncharacterized protein n=1 Tax=Panicum virgatum TaxID=38727 RepID=A0A8T0WG77_PANVG|nr:hypothetical protein PVAP13_1NG020600 [Panicum virgatum]